MWKCFNEHLAVLQEAAGVRKYVLGAAISLAIGLIDIIEREVRALFVDWLDLSPSADDLGMVLGFSSWIVGLAIAFLILFWWVIKYSVRLRRQLNPVLEASFDPDAGGVSETTLTVGKTGEIVDTVKYVRLAVKSASRKSVRECVVNLVKIERRLDLERTETLWNQDALPLQWAMTGGHETKIHYLTKRYVDVARILRKTGQFEILTIVPNRLAPDLQKIETFLLTIVVTGEGIELWLNLGDGE